jgi:hypothetical protein
MDVMRTNYYELEKPFLSYGITVRGHFAKKFTKCLYWKWEQLKRVACLKETPIKKVLWAQRNELYIPSLPKKQFYIRDIKKGKLWFRSTVYS